MKKATIILLSLLMVLAIGQAAFAKGSVGLTVGYDMSKIKWEADDSYNNKGILLGLSGEYNFTNKLSLSGGASFGFGKDDWDYKFIKIIPSLFVKYDIFSFSNATIGVQAGASALFWSWFEYDDSYNAFYISPGLYVNCSIIPQLNVYGDVKLPVYYGGSIADYCDSIEGSLGFFKLFLYDATIGVTYNVSNNINVGVEANLNNFKDLDVMHLTAHNTYDEENNKQFNFSIGAKVGYSF